METQKHLLLKDQAIRYLRSIGWGDNEIHEEYPYKGYLIDIAAIDIKSNEKILIECGTIRLKKYEELRSDQNIKFIHLPYITKSIIVPPSAKKQVINGIVTCSTNVIGISKSKYIRLPYLLVTDSAFPFSEQDTLVMTIENNQLVLEKKEVLNMNQINEETYIDLKSKRFGGKCKARNFGKQIDQLKEVFESGMSNV